MGIEWYLVNRKTHSLFELGKGASELADLLATGASLELKALEDVVAEWWGEDENDGQPKARVYAAQLAPRLIEFVGDAIAVELDVVNDCDDGSMYYRALGYVVIDCLYTDLIYHPAPCPICRSAEYAGSRGVHHRYDCPSANRNDRWYEEHRVEAEKWLWERMRPK